MTPPNRGADDDGDLMLQNIHTSTLNNMSTNHQNTFWISFERASVHPRLRQCTPHHFPSLLDLRPRLG